MTFTCPNCGSTFAPNKLRMDWRSAGRSECPECGIGLRASPPYPQIVMRGSIPILCFLLVTKGIQGGLLFSAKLVVIWIVVTIVISALLAQIKPPKLKLDTRKDRDAPIELFGKRRQ
jgi:hypothetical protein